MFNIVGTDLFQFEEIEIAGWNSIPNQVAFLSGCIARDIAGESLALQSPGNRRQPDALHHFSLGI